MRETSDLTKLVAKWVSWMTKSPMRGARRAIERKNEASGRTSHQDDQ